MISNLLRYFLSGCMGALLVLSFGSVAQAPSQEARYQLIAHGERVLDFSDARLVLLNKPCEIGAVLASVEPQDREKLKGGLVVPHIRGSRSYKLCYFENEQFVAIVDEQGNSGLFTPDMFVHPEPKKPGVSI